MEAEFARGSKSEVGGLKRYICVDLCLFAVVFGLGEACGGEKRLATGLGGRETGILTANGRKWTRMGAGKRGNFSRKTGNGQENRRGNFPKSEVRGPRSEVGEGAKTGGQLRNARIARKWGLENGVGRAEKDGQPRMDTNGHGAAEPQPKKQATKNTRSHKKGSLKWKSTNFAI